MPPQDSDCGCGLPSSSSADAPLDLFAALASLDSEAEGEKFAAEPWMQGRATDTPEAWHGPMGGPSSETPPAEPTTNNGACSASCACPGCLDRGPNTSSAARAAPARSAPRTLRSGPTRTRPDPWHPRALDRALRDPGEMNRLFRWAGIVEHDQSVSWRGALGDTSCQACGSADTTVSFRQDLAPNMSQRSVGSHPFDPSENDGPDPIFGTDLVCYYYRTMLLPEFAKRVDVPCDTTIKLGGSMVSSVDRTSLDQLESLEPHSPQALGWRPEDSTACNPIYDVSGHAEFGVCLSDNLNYTRSMRTLKEAYGSNWQDELWAPLREQGWSDMSDADVDRMLVETVGKQRWDVWPTSTGYTPETTATPRRAFARHAIRRVLGFKDAIPEMIQGWEVREGIIGPLRRGEMRYHVWGEDLGERDHADNKERLLALAARLVAGDDEASDAALQEIEERLIAAFAKDVLVQGTPTQMSFTAPFDVDIDLVCRRCRPCEPERSVDLRYSPSNTATVVNPERIRPNKRWGATSLHGPLTDFGVWFAGNQLDMLAALYDWLLVLATRHFAMAVVVRTPGFKLRDVSLTSLEAEEQALRHHVASRIVLRMAESVVAHWACEVLLHETGHNLSLYHCREPDLVGNTRVHCLQDRAAKAWWTYVNAKLGLATGVWESSDPLTYPDITFTLTWETPPGPKSSYSDSQLSLLATERDLEGNNPDERFFHGAGRQQRLAVVHCVDDPALSQGIGRVLTSLGYLGVLLALTLFFTGAWVLLLLEVFLIDAFDEPDSRFRREHDGGLEFVIRTPLQPDSTVESCCFRNLEADCGDTEAPCWEDGGPDHALGCCGSYVADEDPPGTGGPRRPGEPPRITPPDSPWPLPNDDDMAVIVDGIVIS